MLSPKLKQKIAEILRDRRLWALVAILAVGAYLRLWHIDSLLHFYTEYDEGTLSLQARFITEGFLPYQDFTMVHPPLYYLMLAVVYKIFGYSLFYAKYMSVFFSLASIILIYLTGKKLFRTGPALVAAGLFAISPDMVYIGRRVIQESFGLFLIILALYFIACFVIDNRKKALVFSGLALGFALATKYTLFPAVSAAILVLIIYLMGERYWDSIKRLARPSFILLYVLLTAIVFSIVFFIRHTFNLPISVPLFDYSGFSTASIVLACGIFTLTFFLSLLIIEKRLLFREWWQCFIETISRREVWYLAGSALFGFFSITGYFWITAPSEFFSQTVLFQDNRLADFPSLITLTKGSLGSWEYLKIAFITGLASLPVALVILNRKQLTRADYFIAIATVVAVLFCQFLGGAPRYYYSVYPFLLLALASFVPGDTRLISADIKTVATDIRIKLLGMAAIAIVFLGTSFTVIVDDTGYDCGLTRLTSNEYYVYHTAIDYLESVSPNKVYASNPIIPALSSQLEPELEIDTFAVLGLKEVPAEQFIQDNIERGVDYFVLDYWARRIFVGDIYESLKQSISSYARLVQRISNDPLNYIEIYQLVPEGKAFLNGDFSQWAKGEYCMVPSGWLTILLGGEGDNGDIATVSEDYRDGKQCVRLGVEEDGTPDGVRTSTFCHIYQSIPFPENNLVIDIMPTFNFAIVDDEIKVPKSGIVFTADGRTLTISFSDATDTEQFIVSEDGNSTTVIRHADMGQWTQESIDLSSYWVQAGWRLPDEVDVSFLVSVHYTSPGSYSLYVAGIAEDQ